MKDRNTVNMGAGYQSTTSDMIADNPPRGGSSVQRPKSSISVAVKVDTLELDRLAIGARVYDALRFKGDRINFSSIIGYDKESDAVTVKEVELLELVHLINGGPKKFSGIKMI